MIDAQRFPLLAHIDSPADLRQLTEEQLPAVAAELRDFLIESVGKVGGHFGAGLGVVELTVALLRLLQNETGSPLTGNWSWVPYLVTLLVASGVAYLSIKAINRTTKRNEP